MAENIKWNDEIIQNIQRDNLELKAIDENGTIGEMIDTINANFQEIAIHGGGPAGADGSNGFDGVDGQNVEYIFALSTMMEEGVHYPSDSSGKEALFNSVEFAGQSTFRGVTWTDHPQGISKEHPDEYVFSRFKRQDSVVWSYDERPTLWAHWGETGKDGDGVEYIFLVSQVALTDDQLESLLIKKESMTDKQKVIYNIDDFFPGREWFHGDNEEVNKSHAQTALSAANLLDSSFADDWNNNFGFCNNGKHWTDDPTGTSPVYPFEYVALRRSNTDENDNKEWSNYSTPALWSSYSKESRTFMIYYCQRPEDNPPATPTGGWWDREGTGKLITDKVGYELRPDGWSDTDLSSTGKITWISSGVFGYDGKNVSWTTPVRITGKDGQNGRDGQSIEFIYALSDTMIADENYPTGTQQQLNDFFDLVEGPSHQKEFGTTIWYDNAQSISETDRVEWVWTRQMVNNEWVVSDKPVLWARWGEDGTDGDGVEYIFHVSDDIHFNTKPVQMADIDALTGVDETRKKYLKLILQLDDFYPDSDWFDAVDTDDPTTKIHLLQARRAAAASSDLNQEYLTDSVWTEISNMSLFDAGWTDNPTGTSPEHPYEYVSIRKTTSGENEKNVWGDFSEPKCWGSYNVRSRIFIVYCNIPNSIDVDAIAPTGGCWNITDDSLQNSINDTTYSSPALTQANMPSNPAANTCYWSDTNVDVEDTVTWMASGTFTENSNTNAGYSTSVKWSNPHRITGEHGINGADGDRIEFIYTDDVDLVYPSNKTDINQLFQNVEDSQETPKYYDYQKQVGQQQKTTRWYDNARTISPENPIVYAWSRQKPAGSDEWEPDPEPWIWSRWGEDGTDGDGIEYIFMTQNSPLDTSVFTENAWNTATSIPNTELCKAIYSVHEFLPNSTWLTANETKIKNKVAETHTFTSGEWTVAWNSILSQFSFDDNNTNLGTWTDNPSSLSGVCQYQYVSIRKQVDGEWTAFSYPALWSKYGISKFTEFAFAIVPVTEELGDCTVTGGSFGDPLNRLVNGLVTKRGGVTVSGVNWIDAPQSLDDFEMIWMISKTFTEGQDNSNEPWSRPQRMTDTSTFNVEWSSADLTPAEISTLNTLLEDSQYNFSAFITGNSEESAEDEWRDAIQNATVNNPNYPSVTQSGVRFDDAENVNNPILMATCQQKNGVWSNWKVTKVKGEKGDKGEPGTSINLSKPITYQLFLANGTTYDSSTASGKLEAEKNNLSPAPSNDDLLIVCPFEPDSVTGMYKGDGNNGLYLWKYSSNTWSPYTTTQEGEAHMTPDGHMIVWDGDSWEDVGKIQGPEGKQWYLIVKYAKESGAGAKSFTTPDDIDAKWLGILIYLEGTDISGYINNVNAYSDGITNPNIKGWDWSVFKGQDGFGYEYIFKKTTQYSGNNGRPSVPAPGANDYKTANVIPTGWSDEPMEPDETNKYVWMCWRKMDHATGRWTDFKGVNGETSADNGVARLWQVYARSIAEIEEYFHADRYINPIDSEFDNTDNTINTTYWKSKDDVVGGGLWNGINRYLFNREVIKYTNNTQQVLEPHFVAVFADGIKSVQDYYIVGTSGDNAPAYSKVGNTTTVITTSSDPNDEEGYDYWTTHASLAKIKSDCRYLWNITKNTYEDDTIGWSDPMVIGVYGQGDNGEDSIYLDLNNEMDSIQISNDHKVINDSTFETVIKMYSGSTLLKIADCEVSGDSTLVGINNSGVRGFRLQASTDNGNTYSNVTYDSVNDEYDFTGFPSGVDCVKAIITLKSDNIIDEYTKLRFDVTAKNDLQSRRSATYTLIGSVNSSTYSIVPSDDTLVISNGTITPSTLTIKVVETVGGKITEHTQNVTGKFELVVKKNGSVLNTNPYSINLNNLSPQLQEGDRLTFTVNVETDSSNPGMDIEMDSETIFVLKQGSDGQPGASGTNGNGYRYYYARYETSKSGSYGSAIQPSVTSATLSSDIPTIKLSNVNLPTSSQALGADASHIYEYRTERYFDGSTWGNWSTPITIAKYLTPENIASEVQTQINNAATNVNTTLGAAIQTINSNFDSSTGKFKGTIATNASIEALVGYVSKSGLSGEINSIGLAGLVVDSNEPSVSLSAIITDLSGRITSVGTSYNALEGRLTNYATTASLNEYVQAQQNFQADVNDEFAEINQTVVKGQYATDSDGYLLVNKPAYTTWYKREDLLIDSNKPIKWAITSQYGGTDVSSLIYYCSLVPIVTSISNRHSDNGLLWIIILSKNIKINENLDTSNGCEQLSSYFYMTSTLKNSVTITINADKDDYTFTGISGWNKTITKESSKATIIAYSVVNLTKYEPQENGTYILTNLDWTIGVGYYPNNYYYINVSNNEITPEVAYTQTTIYEKPLLKTLTKTNSYISDLQPQIHDVYTHLDIHPDAEGYTLVYRATDNEGKKYDVVEIESYGQVSAKSSYNEDLYIIPDDALSNVNFVSTIMDYVNGSGSPNNNYFHTLEDTIHQGESKTLYVVKRYENGLNLPYDYTVSLPQKPNIVLDKIKEIIAHNSSSVGVDDISIKHKLRDDCGLDTQGFEDFKSDVKESLCSMQEIEWNNIITVEDLVYYIKSRRPDDSYDKSNTISFTYDIHNTGSEPMFTNKHYYHETNQENNDPDYDIYGSKDITSTTSTYVSYNGASMYVTSSLDKIKFKCKIKYTQKSTSTPDVTISLRCYIGESASYTDIPFTLDSATNTTTAGTYTRTISTTYIPDIYSYIFQKNTTLRFSPYITFNANSLSKIEIWYKFETENYITGNDILDTEALTLRDSNLIISGSGFKGVIVGSNSFNIDNISNQVTSTYSTSIPSSQTLNMISVFTISSSNPDIQFKLNFNISRTTNYKSPYDYSGMKYVIIPYKYDKYMLNLIKSSFDTALFDETLHIFFNNAQYGTLNISYDDMISFGTNSDNPSITTQEISFSDGYKDGNKYYYTILQLLPASNSSSSSQTINFDTTVTYNIVNKLQWNTVYSSNSYTDYQSIEYKRVLKYGPSNFILDKIYVTANDRSIYGDLNKPLKRLAKDNDGTPTKQVANVCVEDVPYLVSVVSELASLSQTVSQGIACTSIITSVDDAAAVFFAQATKDGSQIYLNANEIGIHSDYFKLDNNGLSMKGNLYATDNDGNITAGVIGYDDIITDTDIKFFAGTNASIKDIREAPFYVTESGFLYAAQISVKGDSIAEVNNSSYYHSLVFNPEKFEMRANTSNMSEYERIRICPLADRDRYDVNGMINIETISSNTIAVNIDAGSKNNVALALNGKVNGLNTGVSIIPGVSTSFSLNPNYHTYIYNSSGATLSCYLSSIAKDVEFEKFTLLNFSGYYTIKFDTNITFINATTSNTVSISGKTLNLIYVSNKWYGWY